MSNNTTQYPSKFKSSDKLCCFEVTQENMPALFMMLKLLYLQDNHFTYELKVISACSSTCIHSNGSICSEHLIHSRRLSNVTFGNKLSNIEDAFPDFKMIERSSFYRLALACFDIGIPLDTVASKESILTMIDSSDLRAQFINELDLFLTCNGHNDDIDKFVMREYSDGHYSGLCHTTYDDIVKTDRVPSRNTNHDVDTGFLMLIHLALGLA